MPKNRKVLDEVILKVVGKAVKIDTLVKKENPCEKENKPRKFVQADLIDNALQIFDGKLIEEG